MLLPRFPRDLGDRYQEITSVVVAFREWIGFEDFESPWQKGVLERGAE